MKIFLIVEGDSDKVIFENQRSWFDSLGLELYIVTTYGKTNMVKTAKKHYKIATLCNADSIVFLPDQNGDECALCTRRKIGMDSRPKAVTVVMKRKMEAWILADGQCIRNSIHLQYSPAGKTDDEIYPKRRLSLILKRKLNYFPTEVEAATLLAPHFSIHRAAVNSTSVKRFKEFIENISGRSSESR